MPPVRSAATLPPAPPATTGHARPVLLFALLGAASGLAGTFGLGMSYGEAPGPGLYMIPAGLWFGLVVAVAVWKLGRGSPAGAAVSLLVTFLAWEASVNLALVLIEPWLKAGPSNLAYGMTGMASGTVGALLTWAGAAWAAPSLRRATTALLVTVTGTLFGSLLSATNSFDTPALLFIPWEAAVAATLAFAFALTRPNSPLPVLTGRGSG